MSRHDANNPDSENTLLSANANKAEPAFAELWQAQVLALAYNLIDNEKIPADQWSETLGVELRHAKDGGKPDNKETFYEAALRSLEILTESHAGISNAELNEKTEAWRIAYLTTPHGNPVELPVNGDSKKKIHANTKKFSNAT